MQDKRKPNPTPVVKIRIWLHNRPEIITQLVMIGLALIVLGGML